MAIYENNKLAINDIPMKSIWAMGLKVQYILRSSNKGNWEECYKYINHDNLSECHKYSYPDSNSIELVESAIYANNSVKYLLDKGANPNSRGPDNVTALIRA